MIKKSESHVFALYNEHLLERFIQGKSTIIDDEKLIHRLGKILRVKVGQTIIIFDRTKHAILQIEHISPAEEIEAFVVAMHTNQALMPGIDWLLPLLEHDALEECWYALTALGASSIQPIVTTKTHRNTISTKEHDRLERIMIAAAEQSKQFVFPHIKPLKSLTQVLADQNGTQQTKVFFDINGYPLLNLIKTLQTQQNIGILCLIGPEGDLTTAEKSLLKSHGFSFYALTQSILRSQDALWVSMGSLRSLIIPFEQIP